MMRKLRSRCGRVNYGDDEHYDIVSAFIKSIRGSDPDAGVYWLARMLEAGEDARFIARRLVILASRRHRARRSAVDPRGRRRGPRRRVRRAARGRAQPRARGDPPRARARSRTASSPRSARPRRRCATGAAGPVPMHLRDSHYRGAQIARSRRRATSILTTRRRVGAAGAPAGRGRRRAVLPAERARRGTRSVRRARSAAPDRPVERSRRRRGERVTMSAGDVLAVVAATGRDDVWSPCSRSTLVALARTLRELRDTAERAARRSDPAARSRARRGRATPRPRSTASSGS